MKTTVIFHSADFDGLFCREIARKFLPDAELIGWDFGDAPVPVPDGQIYIMDLPVDRVFGFNFGADVSKTFCQDRGRIVWIDHHKSSIETHPFDIPGYRIDGVAACRLAWQWFSVQERSEKTPCCGYASPKDKPYCIQWNPGNKVVQCHNCGQIALPEGTGRYHDRTLNEPLAVRLAGEYDIWDKRDPNAELFQHGLRSRNIGENLWDLMLVNEFKNEVTADVGTIAVHALLEAGVAIQYAKRQEDQKLINDYAFTVDFEGLKFLAVNRAYANSLTFAQAVGPDRDGLMSFSYDGRNEIWRVSLYHAPGKEHHDLSQIAVKYGGGGHRGACGFRIESLPFLKA